MFHHISTKLSPRRLSSCRGSAIGGQRFFGQYSDSEPKYPKYVQLCFSEAYIHSSRMGHLIGFTLNGRVKLWLQLIGHFRHSRCVLSFPEYERFDLALLKFSKLFPDVDANLQAVRGEGFCAHAMEDFIYDITSWPQREGIMQRRESIMQIKCPNQATPYKRVPWYYVMQAQSLMARNGGVRFMDLFCWTPKGYSLFRIQRDKELWRLIISSVNDFWDKHVEPGRKRYKNNMDPFVDLADIVPDDHDQNYDYALKKCRHVAACSTCLHYHFSPTSTKILREDLDRKSYYMIETSIATRFKKADLGSNDCIFLDFTMYASSIPIMDDSLLRYILHCERPLVRGNENKIANDLSFMPKQFIQEAVYVVLFRELFRIKTEEIQFTPSFISLSSVDFQWKISSVSSVIFRLQMKSALVIKSGEFYTHLLVSQARNVSTNDLKETEETPNTEESERTVLGKHDL